MPLSLRPGKPLEFSLECDQDLPYAERPIYLSGSKTIEQAYEIEATLNELPDTLAGTWKQRAELLSSLLTGWRNMKEIEYKQGDVAQIESLLNHQEIIELIRKIQSGNTTSPEEKKS